MTGGRVGEQLPLPGVAGHKTVSIFCEKTQRPMPKQATHEALNTRHPTGGREEFDRVR